MYPYITLAGVKIAMTGVGIVLGFIVFLGIMFYLSRRYRLDFFRLFYRLGPTLVAIYLVGKYVDFVLGIGLYPINSDEWLLLFSPYGYNFHFVGVVCALVIAVMLFLMPIKRPLEKKMWIDALFFSVGLACIPTGIFLLLGDDIIGKSTSSIWGVSALHPDSILNTFTAVYPVGLYFSLAAFVAVVVTWLLRRWKNRAGMGLVGFALLILFFGLIIMLQQYPRHGVIARSGMMFDIKQYVAFVVSIWCMLVYWKWLRD